MPPMQEDTAYTKTRLIFIDDVSMILAAKKPIHAVERTATNLGVFGTLDIITNDKTNAPSEERRSSA